MKNRFALGVAALALVAAGTILGSTFKPRPADADSVVCGVLTKHINGLWTGDSAEVWTFNPDGTVILATHGLEYEGEWSVDADAVKGQVGSADFKFGARVCPANSRTYPDAMIGDGFFQGSTTLSRES